MVIYDCNENYPAMNFRLNLMQNIYAQDGSGLTVRKIYYALLLSIFPGMGQYNTGHLIRGISLFILLITISWLVAIIFMYTTSTIISLILLSFPLIAYALIVLDAVYCSLRQKDSCVIKWYNRKWIYIILLFVLFFTINPLLDTLIGRHIVRAHLVDTNSMAPTVLRHDVIVIDKLSVPDINDIVLIEMSHEVTSGSMSTAIDNQILRRIIAIQGDEIEISGKNIYVNGEPYIRKFASFGEQLSPNFYITDEYRYGPETVPDNAYFVLSDARQYSFDSRVFGFVKREQITGIATKIFWSWNRDEGHFIWGRTAKNIN